MKGDSYTTEEVAKRLKVSKLTVYDLIKKGELPSYRVGRQMRIDAHDLEYYIQQLKTGTSSHTSFPAASHPKQNLLLTSAIISGQDLSLDILSKHLERRIEDTRVFRDHNGSLTSLINLYHGNGTIVGLHLFDGDTGEYNLPYIRRILVGHSYVVIRLLKRKAGFYVQPGNPQNIQDWTDLKQPHIHFVNREKGAGIRVLLDEQLRLHQISPASINGYNREETNHISVASHVISGKADAGLGIEKVANMIGVDFVPLATECYDLVILKTLENAWLIQQVKEILGTQDFQNELEVIGGYDLSETGLIMYETL